MKRLRPDIDRQVMLRIEAARIAYALLKRAVLDLQATLADIPSHQTVELGVALIALEKAWAFVDWTHRYATVVSQIRGFRHKDKRYKDLEITAKKVKRMRNYIQHLNSEIPKSDLDIYPISGALSWPSPDRKNCQTLSVGMLPEGTHFHSLPFDISQKAFTGGTTLYSAKHQLDIDQTMNDVTECNQYLTEWLENEKMLQELDANPSFLSVIVPNDLVPPNGERFMRVRFEAGGPDA